MAYFILVYVVSKFKFSQIACWFLVQYLIFSISFSLNGMCSLGVRHVRSLEAHPAEPRVPSRLRSEEMIFGPAPYAQDTIWRVRSPLYRSHLRIVQCLYSLESQRFW